LEVIGVTTYERAEKFERGGAAAVVIAKLRMREKEMGAAPRETASGGRELRRELGRSLGRPAQRGLDLVEEGGSLSRWR
jgi:hypothetical protein